MFLFFLVPRLEGKNYVRFIDKHELQRRVPYSPMQIARLEKAGKFPGRVKLGKNRVAWVEAEVESWCQARVDERDAEDGEEADDDDQRLARGPAPPARGVWRLSLVPPGLRRRPGRRDTRRAGCLRPALVHRRGRLAEGRRGVRNGTVGHVSNVKFGQPESEAGHHVSQHHQV